MVVIVTKKRVVFICTVALLILAVMAVVLPQVSAQPPPPENATLQGFGNGSDIYFRYYLDNISAEIFLMNVSGTLYDSYCIDLYTDIYKYENLTINGPLSNDTRNVNWTAVNYILHTYNYSSAENKDLEAAAIQAAIWYFTSEPYGVFPGDPHPYVEYQFMTDPQTDWYDGRLGNGSALVRVRAFVIINDTKANASDFQFPTRIKLNASEDYVLKDQTINITATVYNQTDAPIYEGVTVKFAITEGIGTLDPDNGTTNDTGQVQINFTGTDANTTTVVAWVEGNYGTLLYGHLLVTPSQNMSTITIVPRSIEGSIVLPIPEQSTIVLTSTGVLALMGYVTYSSRRKKKEE